jgi:hypothetical protein
LSDGGRRRRGAGAPRRVRVAAWPALVAGGVTAATLLAGAGPAASALPPTALPAFRDGPPGRVTGGFGEDTCAACHFQDNTAGAGGAAGDGAAETAAGAGGAAGDGAAETAAGAPGGPLGSLVVEGWAGCYQPGSTHSLLVTLHHPGMAAGGFQLAVRFAADTTQAGELEVPEPERDRVAILLERGTRFAHHTLEGSGPVRPDEARWTLGWVAPAEGGAVRLHVAAVAGDGDDSQLGDTVYTLELASDPDGDCGR